MANRLMTRNFMSMEKAPVSLWANVSIGGTGAATLNALKSLGIKSISRSAAGKYAITLGGPAGVDTYARCLMMDAMFVVSTTGAAIAANIVSDASASTGIITIQCVSAQGTAADPASGEVMLLRFDMSNTSVSA